MYIETRRYLDPIRIIFIINNIPSTLRRGGISIFSPH